MNKSPVTEAAGSPEPETSLKNDAEARKTATHVQHLYGARDKRAARHMALWLFVICGLVAAIVTVGGATRLTDSGLSITEWDVIMGAFPPVGEQGWMEEFEKYRQIPEYHRVNKGMSLDEFKTIYWWEWGHRNLGRFIGMAYLVPWLFFVFSGAMRTTALKVKTGTGIVLIGLQGALGWYMVSSGLVDRVDVSQYRLAAHLGLAFCIFGYFLWLAFNLSMQSRAGEVFGDRQKFWLATVLFGGLMAVQIFLGALVAGLRAGKAYTSWPLMNGEFFPSGYFSANPGFHDLFETMAAVQFNHRIGAYLVFAAAIALWLYMAKAGKAFRKRAGLIVMGVFFQMLLGIWTIMAAVPVSLALLHQLGALALIAAVLYNAYHLKAPLAKSAAS
ncbi:heme A synthase [Parvularcula flava]|uniref:Heme A synthase n=3 Tax=Aquisalinus luteolus TaxID=1566827 RepID=A0ABX0HLU2_9PROT|nr:heme A synthase [Aquisalinus luteolus]